MSHLDELKAERCESPIEEMFMLAAIRFFGEEIGWLDSSRLADLLPPKTSPPRHPYVVAAPQVTIGRYRVDFLFVAENFDGGQHICVAVECDGHEFHEKTKQQAARDKARDRDLAAAGVTVLRFTGAEIWRDPVGCADQVMELISERQGATVEAAFSRLGEAA